MGRRSLQHLKQGWNRTTAPTYRPFYNEAKSPKSSVFEFSYCVKIIVFMDGFIFLVGVMSSKRFAIKSMASALQKHQNPWPAWMCLKMVMPQFMQISWEKMVMNHGIGLKISPEIFRPHRPRRMQSCPIRRKVWKHLQRVMISVLVRMWFRVEGIEPTMFTSNPGHMAISVQYHSWSTTSCQATLGQDWVAGDLWSWTIWAGARAKWRPARSHSNNSNWDHLC